MKTEKFEDKIRKKLESIEPQFQESDWENFQQFSNPNSVGSNTWYNGSIFKIAASIALIGTMFLGVAQYISNKNLANKLAEITEKNENLLIKQKELESTIAKNQKYNFNTNTVNPNSETIEENFTINNPTSNEISRDSYLKKREENKEIKSLLTSPNKVDQLSNNKKRSGRKVEIIIENKKEIANKIGDQLEENHIAVSNSNSKNNSKKNRLFNQKLNARKSNEKINIAQDEFVMAGLNEANINNLEPSFIQQKELNINYLTSKNIKFDSVSKFRKLFKRADFAYYKPQKEEKKKLYFTLADSYLRTGIAANVGRDISSYGINSELFLDQRISLKVGAHKFKLEGNSFITEHDFKDETKRDFRDKYQVKVPPTKPILNIQEEYSLLVVPASINYYHPLQNNFFILSSLGTEFDISGTKSIVYNYSKGPFVIITPVDVNGQNIGVNDFEDLDLDRLSQKTEKKLFNNMTVALGAEKRFGKLAIQGKIIDQFLVKNVEYRKKNVVTGELGISYKF